MKIDELVRNERLDESLDQARKAQRRDEALLRSPTTAPTNFSGKEARRMYQEAREELVRKG
jgi:hypothetical protein